MKKRIVTIPTLLAALVYAHVAKADVDQDNFVKRMPQGTTFVFCQEPTPDSDGCKVTYSPNMQNPPPAVPTTNKGLPLPPGGAGFVTFPLIYCRPNETVVTSSTDISTHCHTMLQL